MSRILSSFAKRIALLLYQNGNCSQVMEYAKDVPYPVIFHSPVRRLALLLYQNGDCSLVMEYAKDGLYPVIFHSPGK